VGSRYIESDAWRLKKAANLVKLLSLEPGHRMHPEQVIDLLWPESGRKSATNNLLRSYVLLVGSSSRRRAPSS
jgi:DNA-binding SARP family transcriptional activator